MEAHGLVHLHLCNARMLMVWSIYICGMHGCSWYGPSTFVECMDAHGMVHLHLYNNALTPQTCSWQDVELLC